MQAICEVIIKINLEFFLEVIHKIKSFAQTFFNQHEDKVACSPQNIKKNNQKVFHYVLFSDGEN